MKCSEAISSLELQTNVIVNETKQSHDWYYKVTDCRGRNLPRNDETERHCKQNEM